MKRNGKGTTNLLCWLCRLSLKTSITTNLSGVLASKGQKVLIIDTDNQGNAALSFGKNPDSFEYTTYDVLVDGLAAEMAISNVYQDITGGKIDLLGSNDDMAFLDFDVLTQREKYPEPFLLLKNAVSHLKNDYDFILIDSPPNLGLITGNVLSFADEVIIPFQPESYSMRSLVKILQSIHNFREQYNKKLSVLGIVATLVDTRTTLHSQVLQECRKYCYENGIQMFETVIPRSVRFASSVAYEGLPATLSSDKSNKIVRSYYDLLQEIEERKGVQFGSKK
ncbi:ParA family protein [Aeribacillus alveayuensis]|uniref:Chromosome partitioning protein n=1 Tax=Aeribacillus alveayuensis TaxID=279215 RepID=A0ABT9VST7_9BACI|nr:chromosome partitioning protein [Bacillus alveayuensis]